MDYQSHMFKFAPIVSEVYVMNIVANELSLLMKKMQEEIAKGQFKTLDLLHHLTSGLKSLYTTMAYDSIETVRVNCGGAGYSVWSGLPNQYTNYSPIPIYEGDNTVMAQQVTSYIKKLLKGIGKGRPANGYFEYLNDLDKLCQLKCKAKSVTEFSDITLLEEALKVRAAWHVRDVSVKYGESKASKHAKKNDLFATDLLQLTKAHFLYISLRIYRTNVEQR